MQGKNDFLLAWLKLSFAFCLSIVLLLPLGAQQGAQGELEKLVLPEAGEEFTAEQWQAALRLLPQVGVRTELVNFLRYDVEEFPRQAFVESLSHPELSVRLGALEVLEDFAGGSFEYNPWLNPEEGSNADALQNWQIWAQQGGELAFGAGGLSEEQIEVYLRALFSSDQEQVERALRMLETDRLPSLRAVMAYLAKNEGSLSVQQQACLTRAKYQLVLSLALQDSAPRVARELSMGSRDEKLNGLSALRSAGMGGIPVAREFLNSSDALVRESAIETLVKLAGRGAVEWIAPVLRKETDVNVIHTSLRLLSDIGEKKLQVEFLLHPDEDIVITVLENLAEGEASTRMTVSDIRSVQEAMEGLGMDIAGAGAIEEEDKETTKEESTTLGEQVLVYLQDPRWRVRVAALNYVKAKKMRNAADLVIELIGDEDAFVRARALQTAVEIAKSRVNKRVQELLDQNPDWFEEMARGLSEARMPFPEEMYGKLDTLSADQLVGVINGMGSDNLEVLTQYARSKNLDVACAALRRLASQCSSEVMARGLMVGSIRTGSEEKIRAIVESLNFPYPNIDDPRLKQLPEMAQSMATENPAMDAVYDGFLSAYQEANPNQEKGVVRRRGEQWSMLENTLADYLQGRDPKDSLAFEVARLLLRPNDKRAFEFFITHYEALSLAQRIKLAERAYYFKTAEALPLLEKMLGDEDAGVRSEVADNMLNDQNLLGFIAPVFAQLGDESAQLRGSEVYGSNLERLFRQYKTNSSVRKILRSWAIKTLEGNMADEKKVLALLILERGESPQDKELIESYLRNPNPWLRRMAIAAYQAVAEDELLLEENWRRFAKDENWRVREGLAMSFLPDPQQWTYWFDNETKKVSRFYDYSSNSSARAKLSAKQQEVLNYLMEQDGRAEVRFEASMVMLIGGGSLDMNRFLSLLEVVPKEAKASQRLSSFVRRNYRQLSPEFRALLNRIDLSNLDEDDRGKIVSHFSGSPERGLIASFDELLEVEQESAKVSEGVIELIDNQAQEGPKEGQKIKLLYFYQVGCEKCERAEKMLEDFQEQIQELEIQRYDINTHAVLNSAIAARIDINAKGKTPGIFTQEGALVDRQVNRQALAQLLEETRQEPVEEAWYQISQEEEAQAEQELKDELAGMSWWKVFSAGLIDGVNPCAFATIIFFLSWLQVSRRSPAEILAVGMAFVVAVFATYLSLGLLLYRIIGEIREKIDWAATVMNIFFACLVLVLAFLSLRDAWKAKQGKMEEMSLQLPGMMKEGIKKVVRKSAKRGFLLSAILAAFLAGVVISVLELACTGQVYIPIINGIINGQERALSLLVLFNTGFIIPLFTVFILAFFGMTSKDLITFQQKYTTLVKVALGLLFLVMFVYLLGHLNISIDDFYQYILEKLGFSD